MSSPGSDFALPVDERTPLLTNPPAESRLQQKQPPSAAWVIFPGFWLSLLGGAAVAVELEVLNQIACRQVFPMQNEFESNWAEFCRKCDSVQKLTTALMTQLMMFGGLLSALTIGPIGALSDRKGRVRGLILTTLGTLGLSFSMLLLIKFPHIFGYKFAFVGILCSGLFGGDSAAGAIACAYLADLKVNQPKTRLLVTFSAVQYAGACLGPLLGALIYNYTEMLELPYIALGFFCIGYLVVLRFFTPESVNLKAVQSKLEQPSRPRPSVYTALYQIFSPMKLLWPVKTESGRNWNLSLIAISYACGMIVPTPVKILYARAQFNFGPKQTGEYISTLCVVKLLGLLIVLPFANTKISDLNLVINSIFISIFGYSLLSSAAGKHLIGYYIASGLTALSAIGAPGLQSLALNATSLENSGKVLAALTALGNLFAQFIGPAMFGAIYVATIGIWPQAIFAVDLSYVVISLIPILIFKLNRRID